MKLKSLMLAAVMLAFAGASMAQIAAPAKKQAHKKVHVVKHHAAKHKKAAAM